MGLELRWFGWQALSLERLYDWLQLRSAVFVVEQACAYQELDGLDARCEHLLALDEQGRVRGGLRRLPAGLKYPEASLGRLVVAPEARRGGLARRLIAEGLARVAASEPGVPIRIAGQRYLQGFYESLGFVPVGPVYLEDGIEHVDLVLSPNAIGTALGRVLPIQSAFS